MVCYATVLCRMVRCSGRPCVVYCNSFILLSVLGCGMSQYGAVECGLVPCGMAKHGMVQYSMIKYGVVWYG